MTVDANIGVEVEFPSELYAKLQYIAQCEKRSFNSQVLFSVKQCVACFECLNGKIKTGNRAQFPKP